MLIQTNKQAYEVYAHRLFSFRALSRFAVYADYPLTQFFNCVTKTGFRVATTIKLNSIWSILPRSNYIRKQLQLLCFVLLKCN